MSTIQLLASLVICLLASSASSQWLSVHVLTYSQQTIEKYSVLHTLLASANRSQSTTLATPCSAEFPILANVVQNVTSRNLICFGCISTTDGVPSGTAISCLDQYGAPAAIARTNAVAAGLFAMPGPSGGNLIFIPSMQSDVGSVLFDPVQNAIVKTVSPTRFQGAPYSMAFNPHTNTIYSYSPKTGYVNSDFLLETQSLSSPNPNLVTSYVCNTAVGPLGVGPIDGVQLLWDDFTNTLLAVTRTRDLGDPYGWIKVGRFDPVAQKCTLIFTKQTGSSVKQLIAGLNSKQQKLGMVLEYSNTFSATPVLMEIDLIKGTASQTSWGWNLGTLQSLVWTGN